MASNAGIVHFYFIFNYWRPPFPKTHSVILNIGSDRSIRSQKKWKIIWNMFHLFFLLSFLISFWLFWRLRTQCVHHVFYIAVFFFEIQLLKIVKQSDGVLYMHFWWSLFGPVRSCKVETAKKPTLATEETALSNGRINDDYEVVQ